MLVGTATNDAGVPTSRSSRCWTTCCWRASPARWPISPRRHELRLLSRHAARHLPVGWPPENRPATAAATCSRPSPALFRSLARDRPLAVVLDDLHWAQLPTVALLEHLVHAVPEHPDAGRRHLPDDRPGPLRRTQSARLADLHRLDGVRRLDLAGLDTEAIAEFVCQHAGVSPAGARAPAAILRDRTGGNPFFLRETWLDLERTRGVAPCAARSGYR